MQKQSNKQKTTPVWLDSIFRWLTPARKKLGLIQPSATTDYGAAPNGSGSSFRVWAPHAEQVFVTGSFNNWSLYRTPLARERDGVWSVDVAQAGIGDEYKFVLRRKGETLLRTDPYARDVSRPFSNGIIRRPHATAQAEADALPFQPPARHELVIYELHVGTFAGSPQQLPGGFQGVIDRLPYLQALGINAIEIMPIKAFPGEFSWGYNPSYPFAISNVYGGGAAFQQLVRAAHDHGIAVIVDVVYNHFGPDDLSLWQFDGWQENGKGGIYFYNDWRSQTPWADTRPDYGRSEVRRFIRDNVMMWYEQFGVDGLRWDATSYIRNAHGHDGDRGADIPEGWQMMAAINDEVNGRFPHALNVAEDLQGNEWVTKSTDEGGAGFDTQWDANFVHPVRHAVIVHDDDARDMAAVSEAVSFCYGDDPFNRVIYTESHDEVANGKARVPEEIAPQDADNLFAKKRSTLGAALVFTAPGIPMIFQGQEFLEDGWFTDQEPLDWARRETHAGIWQLYQDLIRLRRNLDGVSRGLTGAHVNVFRADNAQRLLAFHRWQEGGPGDDVIVIANFSHQRVDTAVGLPHDGLWRVRFNSDRRRYDPDFGDTACPDVIAVANGYDHLPFHGVVRVAPYAVLILSQDGEQ